MSSPQSQAQPRQSRRVLLNKSSARSVTGMTSIPMGSPSSSWKPYRSARAVRPPHNNIPSEWTRLKLLLLLMGASSLAMVLFLPMYLVNTTTMTSMSSSSSAAAVASLSLLDSHGRSQIGAGATPSNPHVVGLSSLLYQSGQIRKNWKSLLRQELEQDLPLLFHPQQHQQQQQQQIPQATEPPPLDPLEEQKQPLIESEWGKQQQQKQQFLAEEVPKVPSLKSDQQSAWQGYDNTTSHPPLARGVAGLPMSQTPALVGAQRGHLSNCDAVVKELPDLVYWNDPVGTRDIHFKTPFAPPQPNQTKQPEEYFLSFVPDRGGWNNVRMSFENMVVLAAATGRTLILPPKQPVYLLGLGEAGAKSFGHFLSISSTLSKRIPIMTTSDFVKQHLSTILKIPDNETELRLEIQALSEMCLLRPGSSNHCDNLYKYFQPVGWQPDFHLGHQCLIFDEHAFTQTNATDALPQGEQERRRNSITRFCGPDRTPVYYNETWTRPKLLHWDLSDVDKYRVLDHFYATMYFTDTKIDNYMKYLSLLII